MTRTITLEVPVSSLLAVNDEVLAVAQQLIFMRVDVRLGMAMAVKAANIASAAADGTQSGNLENITFTCDEGDLQYITGIVMSSLDADKVMGKPFRSELAEAVKAISAAALATYSPEIVDIAFGEVLGKIGVDNLIDEVIAKAEEQANADRTARINAQEAACKCHTCETQRGNSV